MFNINQLTQEISLNRGDTATFSLNINAGTDLYPLEFKLKEKDCLYMGIEEPNQPFEKAIVKKVINTRNNLIDKDGNILVDIEPDDTVCLMPGLYYYEIKAKLYRGNQFKNKYLTITFNDDLSYSIVDEEVMNCLSYGTYVFEDNIYTLTDSITHLIYEFKNENNFWKLSSINDNQNSFVNLLYKQCEDEIDTIIPQTRFIVER